MKNSSDFKFDLTFAFVIFAFVIIIVTTYTSIYMFNNLTTKQFKDKIQLVAQNMYNNYKSKERTIKNTTLAIAKNDIFNTSFTPSINIIKSVFKTMLYANSDLREINYYNSYGKNIISCDKKNGIIFCKNSNKMLNITNLKSDKNIFFLEKFKKNAVEFIAFSPTKIGNTTGFIEVKALIENFFIKNNLYNLIFFNKKGDILYSNLYNAKTLNDIFNYFITDEILKIKNGFVTDNIYVKSFSPDMKIIFTQNQTLINKTNNLSKKLTIFMLVFSLFLAIPLGVFFSKPLYHFYKELDKRVNEEIEKRRQKEQLLMQQSKLAALGEMLGNIAHQWRHPLTRLSLIIQNFELAAKKNKLTPEYVEKFKNNASLQIKYMSDTIDDFTNFFKRDTEKINFYPENIIKDTLNLLEGRLKQNRVEINVNIINSVKIKGYKSEFSQVILNIINNAIDILKERNIKNKKINISVNASTIKIEDNAGGIPENIKDKIFEPYFTTKFQSQGTGIGLYMSKIIITQHFGGELFAYNSKDGAVFVIKI